MKPDSYLVNTSRGPTVNETALVDALQRKSIAGAALDTYNIEPLPKDHGFLGLHNTVMTPHNGYVIEETYRAFYAGVVEDIRLIEPSELTGSHIFFLCDGAYVENSTFRKFEYQAGHFETIYRDLLASYDLEPISDEKDT